MPHGGQVHIPPQACVFPLPPTGICPPPLLGVCVPPRRARPTPWPYVPLWQPFAPPIELCGLQPMQYNGSLYPVIQRGSDVATTVDKVTPVFPLLKVNMVLTLI
jgi:hypothetical protein